MFRAKYAAGCERGRGRNRGNSGMSLLSLGGLRGAVLEPAGQGVLWVGYRRSPANAVAVWMAVSPCPGSWTGDHPGGHVWSYPRLGHRTLLAGNGTVRQSGKVRREPNSVSITERFRVTLPLPLPCCLLSQDWIIENGDERVGMMLSSRSSLLVLLESFLRQ